MKLNDLNKIEEGIITGIRGMLSGQGGYQTRVQDLFIKDFVQDATTSLNNGIKSGLVVSKAPAAPAPNDTPPEKAAATAAATQQDGQAADQTSQPQTQYYGKIAPNAGPATKPAPAANPFTAPTVKKTTVTANPSSNSQPGGITKGGASFTKESTYNKLNALFESIINIDEDNGAMSISEYMLNWFGQYMQGTEWNAKKPLVMQKLQKLETEYPKNVSTNLKDLARLGLALSKSAIPAGAPPEFSQAAKQGTAAATGTVTQLKASLDNLAKTNPEDYNALIKSLRPVNTAMSEGKRKKK